MQVVELAVWSKLGSVMCLTINCKSADLGWPQLEPDPLRTWSLLQQANLSHCKVRAVKATTTKKKSQACIFKPLLLQNVPTSCCSYQDRLLPGLSKPDSAVLLKAVLQTVSRGDAMNELCLIKQRKHKVKGLEWPIICYVAIKNHPQTFNMKQLPFNSLPVQDESSTALSWAQSTLLLRLGNLQCPYTMTESWSTYQLDHVHECTKPEHSLVKDKKLITKGQLITLFNNF